MLFTTTTQFVALAITLVAGWIFGLASHPGGKKWKSRYTAERDAHAGVRKESDGRVTEANRRIAELEKDNARLAKAVPVAAAPVASVPVETARTRPVYSGERLNADGTRRGWFDFGDTRRV